MQADRRLVEDIQHADEAAADLRREADPLCLSARERHRGAFEREIVEAHVDEKAQPVRHFFENGPRDVRIEPGAACPSQRNLREEVERLTDGKRHDVADALARHQDREAFRLEAAAAARGARLFDHVLLELLAHCIRPRLAVAFLYVIEHALPTGLVRAVPPLAVVLVGDRLSRRAPEQDLLDGRRQIAPGCIEIELVGLGEGRQHHLP